MSFGNRMRAKQSRVVRSLGAIVAALGVIGVGSAPIPDVTTQQATQQQVSKEFADTAAKRKRTAAPVENKIKGGGGLRVRWDSRKGRRRMLCLLAGVPNTGRQWVRLRKELRASGHAHLLHMPAWALKRVHDERAKHIGRKVA